MTRGLERGKKQCSEREREVCKCVYLSTFVCACVCVYLLSTLTLYRIHCELLPPRRPWWLSLSPVGISILHFVLFQLFLTYTHTYVCWHVYVYILCSAPLFSPLLFSAASACFVVLLSTATVAQVCIVSRLFIYLPTWLPHTCFFLFFTLLSHPSPPSLLSPFCYLPFISFNFSLNSAFSFFPLSSNFVSILFFFLE